MWKRHFEFITHTQPQIVIEIVSHLLTKRSVEHTVEGNYITSTYIPIPLLNWDKRLYSHDNFVGVNPFIFIDRLTVEVKPETGSKTQLYITARQGRAYVPLVFLISLAVSISMVDSFARWILPIIAILYYLFAFRVVVGSLLLREIQRALQQSTAPDHR